jgi:2-polyprenyl-3-methyl-5-hydroxy-6-metoxy-1,4-benzoquinol methylase
MGTAMSARDIFQSVRDLGPEAIQRIVDRLGYRGRDPTFVRMREAYLDRMGLTPNARVLETGCGTGVVSRALARRTGFAGAVVGIDFSDALIQAARRLAREEKLDDRIKFRVGDSHALDDPDSSYDCVIAHTLLSHVVDPAKVISEAARVVRPKGMIAIFDGDYASLAYGAGDPELNARIVEAILAAVAANPHVMRQVPTLLRDCDLSVLTFLPGIHAEAGEGAFFLNVAESYLPIHHELGSGLERSSRPLARCPARGLEQGHLLRRLQLLCVLGQ